MELGEVNVMQFAKQKDNKIPWWVWAAAGVLLLFSAIGSGGGDRCPTCWEWVRRW